MLSVPLFTVSPVAFVVSLTPEVAPVIVCPSPCPKVPTPSPTPFPTAPCCFSLARLWKAGLRICHHEIGAFALKADFRSLCMSEAFGTASGHNQSLFTRDGRLTTVFPNVSVSPFTTFPTVFATPSRMSMRSISKWNERHSKGTEKDNGRKTEGEKMAKPL